MTGSVAAVNPKRGMVAVLTDEGAYSIIEMLGDDPPDIGDRIRWRDSTPLGSETVRNLTRGQTYEVYFQNHHVLKGQLRQQLLLEDF